MSSFIIEDVVKVFADTFAEQFNTILVSGAKEPFYQAARAGEPAKIFARADYFSSALHEVAHWCVAGPKRRLCDDFGYWYEADGRSPEQQAAFEHVEVYPQSLEWAFHIACGKRFMISVDNLSHDNQASTRFSHAVSVKAQALQGAGYPNRAAQFITALEHHYQRPGAVASFDFNLAALITDS